MNSDFDVSPVVDYNTTTIVRSIKFYDYCQYYKTGQNAFYCKKILNIKGRSILAVTNRTFLKLLEWIRSCQLFLMFSPTETVLRLLWLKKRKNKTDFCFMPFIFNCCKGTGKVLFTFHQKSPNYWPLMVDSPYFFFEKLNETFPVEASK